jgi:hypothetical protein
MNGVVVLRAVWEDGRKVSEQRVRPGDGGSRRNEQAEIEQPEDMQEAAAQEEDGQEDEQ